MNYYNEFDPKAAAWLRELIRAGEIPEGQVDERSIVDVKPGDLAGYVQCHFFAGIGGWAYALRLTGWPESRPVWTASLPCQPFSNAGQQRGVEDDRHLWPIFFNLVKICCPDVIFGEQVARAIGFNWLDGISADLERASYAVGAHVLGAHSLGADHQRQRLYWMAESNSARRIAWKSSTSTTRHGSSAEPDGDASAMAHAGRPGNEFGRGTRYLSSPPGGDEGETQKREWRGDAASDSCATGPGCSKGIRLADSDDARSQGRGWAELRERSGQRPLGSRGAWDNYEWLPCTDEKARRIESGTFPLAHGVSGRVGLLRGYGNAIVPQVAAEFIGAYLDIERQQMTPSQNEVGG